MIKVMHEFLVYVKEYKHIIWTFSGGKGAHCRVFDDKVRVVKTPERKEILEELKFWASKKGVTFKVDEQVTTDFNRILGLPFSVHGDTLRILVPFDPAKPEELLIEKIPTAYDDRSALQPYVDIAHRTFIKGMAGVYSKPASVPLGFKGPRNSCTGDNTYLEGTEHEELW
jgi:DNA primase catalytic subunit